MEGSKADISESTKRLREKIRVFRSDVRHGNRGAAVDVLRSGLGEVCKNINELENITEKDVVGLASRIKRRKHASEEDLFRLSHAFLQSIDNIAAFMNIPGALNVLVKELTGSNSKLQIMSCEALCNLSLGNAVHCEKLAATAGSYLVTHLDNSNTRLQRTSLWILINILATDGKGFGILASQKVIPKLLHLYTSSRGCDIDEEVLVAIDIVLDHVEASEKATMTSSLLTHFRKLEQHNELHLKIMFTILFDSESLHLDDAELADVFSDTLKITIRILYQLELFDGENHVELVLYAIRIIANILVNYPDGCERLAEICNVTYQIEFVEIVNKIFGWNNKSVNKELLWLTKNLVSSQINLNKSSNVLTTLRLSKLTIL